MRDGLALIKQEHDVIRGMFDDYTNATRGEARLDIVANMVKFMTQHASIEERALYPKIREQRALYERARTDDKVNKELIEWLDGRRPSDELEWKLYDKTVHKLISVGLEQLEEQEDDIMYYLRDLLSPQELNQLADDWEEAKATAPQHSHPHASTQPLAAKVVHPALQAVDKATDAVKDAIQHDQRAQPCAEQQPST